MDIASEATRLTSFVTLGAMTTAQRMAGSVLEVVQGTDPGRVAEETLSLVAVTSARAAAVGLAAHAQLAHVVGAEVALVPVRYHDYLVGEAMLTDAGLGSSDDLEAANTPPPGLEREVDRMIEFYSTHFVPGQFPGERHLADKLELWMGRIIPPRSGTHPAQWLERVGAIQPLATHNRIVLAYCRKAADELAADGRKGSPDQGRGITN